MIVVFDMDNTLADELGASARPGITGLLSRFRADGHILILWTSSTRQRAVGILQHLGLIPYFDRFVFREDYDPALAGIRKDIRTVHGDILIDDDPAEIRYMEKIGRRGILISPYRKGQSSPSDELEKLYTGLYQRKKFLKRILSTYTVLKSRMRTI